MPLQNFLQRKKTRIVCRGKKPEFFTTQIFLGGEIFQWLEVPNLGSKYQMRKKSGKVEGKKWKEHQLKM